MAKPIKGKVQVATQLTAELWERWKAYCDGRGETYSAGLERAMQRDMRYPPPKPEDHPLADPPKK